MEGEVTQGKPESFLEGAGEAGMGGAGAGRRSRGRVEYGEKKQGQGGYGIGAGGILELYKINFAAGGLEGFITRR